MGSKPSKKADSVAGVQTHVTGTRPPAESFDVTQSASPTFTHADVCPIHAFGSSAGSHSVVKEVAAVTTDDVWTGRTSPCVGGGGAMSSASTADTFGAMSSASTASTSPFCFVSSLDEVIAQASESFGQGAVSLQSSKWDQRAQALKTVGSVLKGLKLDVSPKASNPELNRCFEISCMLLNHALRDRVLPVLFAAHELYNETFQFAVGVVPMEHIRYAMHVLFEHLCAKLGDSNIRLHESAQASVLLSAEQPCFGLQVVLQKLLRHMNGDGKAPQKVNAKTMSGTLDTVNFLLQHFPGRREDEGEEEDAMSTWTPSNISPFVVNGLKACAGLPRVKNSAVNLAVSMHGTLGMKAVQPLLDSLRPAMRNVLKQKFAESEGEGGIMDSDMFDDDECDVGIDLGADFDGLMVCGVGLKAPTPAAKSHANVLTDGEENFMDQILEETGLVFDGGGSIPIEQRDALDDEIDGLGIDLDGDHTMGDTAKGQDQVKVHPQRSPTEDSLDLLEDSLDRIETSNDNNMLI